MDHTPGREGASSPSLNFMLPLALTAAAAFAGALLGLLLGLQGATLALRLRVDQVEGDLATLSGRLTREQKVRAGQTLQANARDNLREAEEIAARSKAAPRQHLPGRTVFNE